MYDSQVIYRKRVRNLRGLLMGIPCLGIFSLPWIGVYEILTGKRHELDYPWWGQVLLALRMGKSRVIAETGAGQHGVATATA